MAVICKLFIRTRSQSPDGGIVYELGAVCRGEENKEWSSATPTGSLKHPGHPVLDAVWEAKVAGRVVNPEVYVTQVEDPDGEWAFEKCEFTYGGCAVAFRQKVQPWGVLETSINARPATEQLRSVYADSLRSGTPARYRLEIEDAAS